MGRTVEELEHSMSHSELMEWDEFLSDEPLPSQISELQLAVLTKVMAGKESKVKDFLISGKNLLKKMKPKQRKNQSSGFVKDTFF